MNSSACQRPVGFAALAALAIASCSIAAAAAAQDSGIYLEIISENRGMSQTLKFSLAENRLRVDMGANLSMILIGGDSGKLLIMMHSQRQYSEMDTAMMQAARAMAPMPPELRAELDAVSASPPTFTRTGNTRQVGSWNAFEVRVEHPAQEDDMVMWLSPDVDADFRGLAERVLESIAPLLGSPLMQAAGLGAGGMWTPLAQQSGALDMPDGFPVQIAYRANAGGATITLQQIDEAASFGADTWAPPADYVRMGVSIAR